MQLASIGTDSAIITSPTTSAAASTVAMTSPAVVVIPAWNLHWSILCNECDRPEHHPQRASVQPSFLFYHAQRSGKLPYQRLAWRSDLCLFCKGQYSEDLSGGYYEAANTMKWGFPLAFTITQLYNKVLESVLWGTDYPVNAHPSPNVFVGQLGVSAVGTTDVDFGYFGPPEEYKMWVPLNIMHTPYYATQQDPSSEITGESAAALDAVPAERSGLRGDAAQSLAHPLHLYHYVSGLVHELYAGWVRAAVVSIFAVH
ncbi:Six-hairpin glycosidase-like protein [Endogone sp. FLAS-F59071]|nr:Six-hairpin glycosidase-like protein [Endogone sp. FLAS-F59071]|eukprot:RUS13517.1 Six-hairpin glycosidase-like protein [Endogone sp. FLAS-F59071]